MLREQEGGNHVREKVDNSTTSAVSNHPSELTGFDVKRSQQHKRAVVLIRKTIPHNKLLDGTYNL
jgi:hypothetical protein